MVENSSNNAFWASTERRNRPIDELIQDVPYQDVYAFVKGTKAIASLVEKIKPSVIFIPERGATPIKWAIQHHHKLTGRINQNFFPLPIGTSTDVETGILAGYNSTQKKSVIYSWLDTLTIPGLTSDLSNPLLIDEVQSGTTLTTAAKHLRGYLNGKNYEGDLYVICAADERKSVLPKNKNKGYVELATNSKDGFNSSIVTLPLFTIDRVRMLNSILRPSDDLTKDQTVLMQMTVHNRDAESLIKNLVTIVEHPKFAHQIIHVLENEVTLPKNTSKIYQEVYFWLAQLLTEPNEIGKFEDPKKIIRWLKLLINYSIDQKNGRHKASSKS